MEPAKLAKYLDAAETTDNTTLCRAMAWTGTGPMSDPVRDLLDCLSRFNMRLGRPVRRMLLAPAALRAALKHPTTHHRVREALGRDLARIGTDLLERMLLIPPGAIEEDQGLGSHVLLFGETEAERYVIFYVLPGEPTQRHDPSSEDGQHFACDRCGEHLDDDQIGESLNESLPPCEPQPVAWRPSVATATMPGVTERDPVRIGVIDDQARRIIAAAKAAAARDEDADEP